MRRSRLHKDPGKSFSGRERQCKGPEAEMSKMCVREIPRSQVAGIISRGEEKPDEAKEAKRSHSTDHYNTT